MPRSDLRGFRYSAPPADDAASAEESADGTDDPVSTATVRSAPADD